MIPLAEGGLMRRPGSRFIAELKSSSVKGRLKRFEFSTTQGYMLELGEKIMRFYRHQGQIVAGDTDASITNGTFASNINDWDDRSTGGAGNQISHDATNGRLTLETSGTASNDIGWAEQDVAVGASVDTNEHVLKFRVLGAPGDRVELRIGTATLGEQVLGDTLFEVGYHCKAFTPGDGNNTIYIQFRNRGDFRDKDVQIDDVSLIDNTGVEIDTPWSESELFQINGPQSADVLYLYHPDHPTYKLLRFGHTSWSLVEVAWVDGPYLPQNTSDTTLLPSANTGLGINLTLSAVTGVNDDQGWLSTDVSRLVRYRHADEAGIWGYAVIVSITSTTVAVADVRADFEAVPDASKAFRLGAWSGTTGYPSIGTFYEQRQFTANTSDQPQTQWATQTADFENHTPDDRSASSAVEDDDALDYTISADEVNAIRWMSPGEDTLVLGTTGGEWIPESSGIVITPSDIVVRRRTTHGSANIQPVRVGNVVLFVQKAKRKIREFAPSEFVDGFRAFDMTRLAQHVTRGGIVEMDFQQEPDSLVWAVRTDGQLLSMTFRREEDVVGWARHIIGGVFKDDDIAIARVWQYDDSTDTFVDETADAGDAGDADWTLFPTTEAVDDYAAFGYTKPFSQLKFDYANGTAGVGGAVDWEYWNGSAWTSLSGVTDGTTGFTAAAGDGKTVTWTLPTDWAKLALNAGAPLYYVRAQISTVYTTNPILDQGYVQDIGDAVVESVAVIPGADGSGQTQSSQDRDEVWITVKRTINGATVRYVEVLERDYEDGDDEEDSYYADSIITYDGAATTSITGLDHLEGETVKVLADGFIHPDQTVVSGAITLDNSSTVVQVGLGYTHTIKPLKFEGGTAAGTAVGKTKQVFGVTFVLLNCHSLTFGPDTDNLDTIDFREVSDPMDAGVPFFTGERFEEFDDDWKTDPRIVIQSDAPVPFTLLALAPEIDIRELK